MRALFEYYRAQLKNTVALQLQYRVALVIWLIGTVLQPVIYLVVWTNVARAGGSVGGYGAGDFAAYFIALMLVDHLTFSWIFYEFEYRIRQGQLSALLLRPIHPIHKDIAENVTYKLLTATVLWPTAAGLALVFQPTAQLSPWALAAFVPALLLGFGVRFLVEWTLALAAFWTTRVSALNQMYYVLTLFLSGQIAPLALLPAPARVAAALLPFRWMVAFPVELLIGRLTPAEALQGLAAQLAWLCLSLVLLRLAWRAGLRRYSAVGA
ncbi:MAG TPA: ABC-2 family transporter protein [Roseiflexaceae bacterium]|nr:ABC-2 family transporter protein [Roseiflexaceae bacterium]